MNNNPIFIVDDDNDDFLMIREVAQEMGLTNEVRHFTDGESLIRELTENPVVPFLIISDMNLPKMNGLELRKKIIDSPIMSRKTIPFIFWSNSASDRQVENAYNLAAHGYFIKGRTYTEMKASLHEIVSYWSHSLSPQ
jgi:CheY-like chemotaxis protein